MVFELLHRLILVGDFLGFLTLLLLFLLQALNRLFPFLQHLHFFLLGESLILLINQQFDQLIEGEDHFIEFAARGRKLVFVEQLSDLGHSLSEQPLFGLLIGRDQTLGPLRLLFL